MSQIPIVLPDLHIVVDTLRSQPSGEWAKTALNILAGGVTAILGGFAGAYLSETFARRRRKADQLVAHELSAFALQLDLMGIYTDVTQYREGLGQSRVASRVQTPGRHYRAQYHQPYAGEQQHVRFRTEDLQALASYGSANLMNVIADIDRRFNTVVDAINQYRLGSLAVSDTMAGDIQGEIIVMRLSEDEVRRLTPKMASLTKLLDNLDSLVEDLTVDTYRAMIGLYQARVKSFGLKQPFEGISPAGVLELVQPDPTATPPEPKPLISK